MNSLITMPDNFRQPVNEGTGWGEGEERRGKIATESEMIAVKYEALNTVCIQQKH
jgi:hypothetical protein